MKLLWLILSFSLAVSAHPLSQADALLEQRQSADKTRLALTLYQKELETQPNDPALLWRMAAAYHFLGYRHAQSEEEKIKNFEAGIEAAEQGLTASPNCAPCHFWLAANTAVLAEARGIFSMLSSLGAVKGHLHRVTELEESYAFAGAHRLLGLIYWKVPGLFGGSNEKAKTHLETAFQVAPIALNALALFQFYEAEESMERATQFSQTATLKSEGAGPENLEALAEWKVIEGRFPAK